ncbi:Arabinose efflux permease [Megamonas hypermegale]|uniref:Arabinose efflux permease n=2 Tax=Megamonas hypermegale TaxID=158847 RepID=A0A239TZZ3_9FIRM|nr:MFS transporter [Megamonas hypermegale]SNV02293.1 Arabinose efflux permease [Megamonas hypermegale]
MQNTMINVKKSHGIIMFIILLLSYIVFASNWVAGSNLSEKIVYHYFNGETVSPMVSEVINYTITIARIFANLVAAYILLKLNPRKASIVALVLLCFSFVAVFATNYWLYTIARMIMALGGSMVMVYMNTVVASFIANDEKIIANALVTASYNIGAGAVAIIFFLYKDVVTSDWQNTMYMFSLCSILLLVLWTVFAKDFSPSNEDAQAEKVYKYKDALTDKFVYCFSMGFGGFLFLYVMSLVSIPMKLVSQVDNDFNAEFMILAITMGGIGGTLFSILIGKIPFERKPFLLIHGITMIISMALGLHMAYINPKMAYFLFAIGGFVMFSQYSVYLNFPHELPNMNPRKLTIMFGVFWALGYTVYTVLNFIWSIILSYYGWDLSMVFYITCSCLYIIFVCTFPVLKVQTKRVIS